MRRNMNRRGLCGSGLLTLLVLAPLDVGAKSGVETWFVDPLIKVFPRDRAERRHRLLPEFWAARNQHVSVQLAIRSSQPRAGVTAEVLPLEGPEGNTIAGATVHRVGYVVVGSHSKDTPESELIGEAPGWYPDPLLDFPFDLKDRPTHSLWVTVRMPADARPGVYRGTIVVRAGSEVLSRASFRIRLVSAAVPTGRSLI